jgi:hypothetical protein
LSGSGEPKITVYICLFSTQLNSTQTNKQTWLRNFTNQINNIPKKEQERKERKKKQEEWVFIFSNTNLNDWWLIEMI